MFSDYLLFIDESGDHGLESIDPNYGVFVLCGVLVHKDAYIEEVTPAIQRIKMDFWGHDQVIFHERDLRKPAGAYGVLLNAEVRERFHGRLNEALDRLPYLVICSVIKKAEYAKRYPIPRNPYDLSMSFVLERAFLHLHALGQSKVPTQVIVEARGRREDAQLVVAFDRIVAGANACRRPIPFNLQMVPKAANSVGLQISDLIARPIGIRVLRPRQPNRAYEIIKTKLARDRHGSAVGWGIKLFP